MAENRFGKRNIISVILCTAAAFVFILSAGINVSAEEIVLEEANIVFDIPEDWSAAYNYKMSDEIQEMVEVSSETAEKIYKSYRGCNAASGPGGNISLYVLTAADEISQKIYNNDTGNYQYISEYLNDPNTHMYIRNGSEVNVIRTSEKINAQNCTFYLTEYTRGKEYGLCCSTVVNGKYISLDYRKLNGEFAESEKTALLNSVRTARAIEISEEEPLLDTRQIVLLGGILLLLIILFAAIIVKRKHNR